MQKDSRCLHPNTRLRPILGMRHLALPFLEHLLLRTNKRLTLLSQAAVSRPSFFGSSSVAYKQMPHPFLDHLLLRTNKRLMRLSPLGHRR